MRRIILAAVVAAASLMVPAASMAAGATGSTSCTGDMSGQTIATNVTVPSGARCDLSWSDIKGNVSVAGSLVTFGKTHFERNVSVVGGSFAASNWGVTIDGNLSFLNPAVYSYNGFWGNYSPNEVKGNLNYTITSDTTYPQYQSPLLYFGGGTQVDGSFTYSTGGVGHLDTGGLHVNGSTSIL
jgi:hypothetical protein